MMERPSFNLNTPIEIGTPDILLLMGPSCVAIEKERDDSTAHNGQHLIG